MKALDFIQIFASNVRRLDFRLSSAQVILAVIAGYRRHSTITEATRLHPNTVTNILQDLGITLVLVTHDLNVAEQAERIIQLEDGRIARDSEVMDR